jgi:hypothetical protein
VDLTSCGEASQGHTFQIPPKLGIGHEALALRVSGLDTRMHQSSSLSLLSLQFLEGP